MGGLVDTIRRGANFAVGKGYKTSGERKRAREGREAVAEKGARDTEQLRLDEMFAGGLMPDEDFLKRAARRKAARRRGSRADTVLTEDTLG